MHFTLLTSLTTILVSRGGSKPWQPGPWPRARRQYLDLTIYCSKIIEGIVAIVIKDDSKRSEFLDPSLLVRIIPRSNASLSSGSRDSTIQAARERDRPAFPSFPSQTAPRIAPSRVAPASHAGTELYRVRDCQKRKTPQIHPPDLPPPPPPLAFEPVSSRLPQNHHHTSSDRAHPLLLLLPV
jgi:hypothetical protein